MPAALLIQFLREHRSEWADCDIDAHAAAAFHNTTHSDTTGHYQLSLPLAKSSEQEEVFAFTFLSTFTALIHLFRDMQYFPSLSALEFLYLIAKPQLSDRAWEIRFGCIDSGGDET